MKLKDIFEMNLHVAVPLTFEQLQKMVEDASIYGFGIVGYEKKGRGQQENIKAKQNIFEYMGSAKLDYYETKGFGQENDENGNQIMVSEPSLLIVAPTYTDILRMAGLAQQDYFIYAGSHNGGHISLYETATEKEVATWTKLVKGPGEFGYTVLRDGTKFHFA